MTLYIAKIVVEGEIIEMPERTSWSQALQDKMYLNDYYKGLYDNEAKIYTYDYDSDLDW